MEDNSEDNLTIEMEKGKMSSKKQYLTGSLVLCTLSLNVGFIMGLSAVLLPQLEEEGIQSKSEEASWIASIVLLSHIFGAVTSASFAGRFGRRLTMIVFNLLQVVAWATLALSNGNSTILIAGRFLQGFTLLTSVGQLYLTEITDTKTRPKISGATSLFTNCGLTIVYILGAYLPWRWVCGIGAGLPMAALLSQPWIPESPVWLLEKGRTEEAIKILKWLRGDSVDVAKEIKSLMPNQTNSDLPTPPVKATFMDNLRIMSNSSVLKPLAVLLTIFFLQQSSGQFAVVFYAVNVFKDAGVFTGPYSATIFTGFVRVIGSLTGTALLSRCSRKSMMVFSSSMMTLFMLGLGLTIHFSETALDSFGTVANVTDGPSTNTLGKVMTVLPLVEVVGFMIMFTFGPGLIPWLLMSEVFPAQVRGFASGLCSGFAHLVIFIVVKSFPSMITTFSYHSVYYAFAIFSLLLAVFSAVFVPETRGKSLAQLENLYDKMPKERREISTS